MHSPRRCPGGGWSTSLNAAQAQALANGSYTVTADVSDAVGDAAPTASRPITVDEGAATLHDDSASVRAFQTVTAGTAQGVLGNDSAAHGGTLTVTGVGDA